MNFENESTDKNSEIKKKEYKQCENCKTTKRKLYEVKSIENGHIENLCYDCRFNRFFGRTLQEILDDDDGFTVAQELFQLVRYGNYLGPYSQFVNYIYFAYITDQIKNGSIIKEIFEDDRHISNFSNKKSEYIDTLRRSHIIEREDEKKYYFTQQFMNLLEKYKNNSNELFSRILGLCLVNVIAFSKYDSTMKQIWLRALTKHLIDKTKAIAYEDRIVEEIKEYQCLECKKIIKTQEQSIEHLKNSHNIDLPKDELYFRFVEPITIGIGYKLYVEEFEKTIKQRMSPSAFMKFFTDGLNTKFYFYSEDGKNFIREDKNGKKFFVVKAPWIRVMCKTLEKIKELELTKEISI